MTSREFTQYMETILEHSFGDEETQVTQTAEIKKQVQFLSSVLIQASMASKRPGELAVVKTTVNSRIYIDILDRILIPSIDNAFGDENVVFQDDNASCHRAKRVKDCRADR